MIPYLSIKTTSRQENSEHGLKITIAVAVWCALITPCILHAFEAFFKERS